jgi:serine/threonine protein kinase
VLPHRISDKFRVMRRVGSGGMGVVYLAHDELLGREVALKTLPALNPDAVRRLRDEARAMAALNHDSLATLYGIEIWRGTPVLVVEYFPNGTLAQRLSRGPLSLGDTIALGVRLARGLVYMHARAVLHRDLKPSNIAFTAAGACKLLDFGLATLSQPANSRDESPYGVGATNRRFAGTLGYAPPEAFRGARPSAESDRWALAVVMLEAASGVNPFAVSHRRAAPREAIQIERSAIGSSTLRAAPELCAFLEGALDPSPQHRFHTSGDFLAALEAVADALAVRVGD